MKNKAVPMVLVVLAVIAAPYLFAYIFFLPVTTYQWNRNLSSEERVSLAEEALKPQIADYVERCGTRGFQDVELRIETVKFSSKEEMAEKISLGTALDGLPVNGSDMKSKKEGEYEIEAFRPYDGVNSKVGADTSLIGSDSLKEYWTWHYSIHEYRDGSCRFIVLVMPS